MKSYKLSWLLGQRSQHGELRRIVDIAESDKFDSMTLHRHDTHIYCTVVCEAVPADDMADDLPGAASFSSALATDVPIMRWHTHLRGLYRDKVQHGDLSRFVGSGLADVILCNLRFSQ